MSTANGSQAPETSAQAVDGTRIWWWEQQARLEVAPRPPDRRGKRQMAVYEGDQRLTSGRVDLADLAERERLAAHCAPGNVEGARRWLGRFGAVWHVLSEEDDAPDHALPDWPLCSQEAYYGLLGELAQTVKPVTEADPVAILVQCLLIAGAMFDHKIFYTVGATRHPPREFAVIVGRTGSGRKGTGLDIARWLLAPAPQENGDPPVHPFPTVVKGCGSGEGLIYAVRDPSYRLEPVRGTSPSRGQKGPIISYERVMVDEGITDKRIIIEETEFAGVLQIARREHNTLSMILRQLWETGDLQNTVKNNPLTATGAHGVMIGHITPEELRTALTTVEVSNGLANRFLWVCARKTNVLPDGDELSQVDFAPWRKAMSGVIKPYTDETRMRRSAETAAMWQAVYPAVSRPFPGLLGAVLGRNVAHVLRLSMIYALLDGSVVIESHHLLAALALWQYCEDSAAYLFGADATGSEQLDRILAALADAGGHGVTREDIMSHVLQRNVSARALTGMLHDLRTMGLITLTDEPRSDGRSGRSRQRVLLREPETYEVNEVRSGRNYITIAKQVLAGK